MTNRVNGRIINTMFGEDRRKKTFYFPIICKLDSSKKCELSAPCSPVFPREVVGRGGEASPTNVPCSLHLQPNPLKPLSCVQPPPTLPSTQQHAKFDILTWNNSKGIFFLRGCKIQIQTERNSIQALIRNLKVIISFNMSLRKPLKKSVSEDLNKELELEAPEAAGYARMKPSFNTCWSSI